MKLTPVMQRYILHWGEMGSRWGVNRSVSQIHALLYLSPRPLHAEEIAETLNIARSNVSTSLKELLSWELVSVAHVLGDRRDHFRANTDVWEIIKIITEGRKRREIDPTIAVLRSCVAELDEDQETPQEVRERIETQLEFVVTLSTWYDSIKNLPRSTLLKMMRMGDRIRRAIGE